MFYYSVFYGQNEKGKEKWQKMAKNLTFLDKDLNPGILREIRSIELAVLKKSRQVKARFS